MEPEPWLVDILKVAVAAFFASSGVAYVVKHVLDQRAAEQQRKREQIARWREMLARADAEMRKDLETIGIVQRDPEFMSLRPHLSPTALEWVNKEGRIASLGHGLRPPLGLLAQEVDRIEGAWGLRK